VSLLGLSEDSPVLRKEFLYDARDLDVALLLDRHSGALRDEGISFQYFKGNDSLLHYTLVDWASGIRRMVDILDQVKALWSKRRHPGEWLYASFRGNFRVEGYLERGAGRDLSESGILELREMSVRLVYNGRAFLGRETVSLVTTCRIQGIITGGVTEEHESNLGMIERGLAGSWMSTKPLFGWLAAGERPCADLPPMAGAVTVPRHAWLIFYPPDVATGYVERLDAQDHLLLRSLDDGSLLVENARERPGESGFFGRRA
jgi:hypothetical protein